MDEKTVMIATLAWLAMILLNLMQILWPVWFPGPSVLA